MKNLTCIVVLVVAMSLASASQLSSSTALTRRTRQSFNLREIEIQLERQGCPAPLRACPILRSDISLDLNLALPKRTISKRNWECSNLQTDVNSCGSCDNDVRFPPLRREAKAGQLFLC
ncbi:hypothetical protein PGTUg99_005977 [Puccinia graminis f. sp. tritici]|uniref:Uncharacterized protein n=1 Tax=Puccinia graminis f. sp. tritici TaxID=56615 RepID=A0A5B0SHK9_PUCGR|nr:hypothetical protein PGTUg99_005977 [Puccinia graminis f. sp. tritici]